jgi:hypothetical protein
MVNLCVKVTEVKDAQTADKTFLSASEKVLLEGWVEKSTLTNVGEHHSIHGGSKQRKKVKEGQILSIQG